MRRIGQSFDTLLVAVIVRPRSGGPRSADSGQATTLDGTAKSVRARVVPAAATTTATSTAQGHHPTRVADHRRRREHGGEHGTPDRPRVAPIPRHDPHEQPGGQHGQADGQADVALGPGRGLPRRRCRAPPARSAAGRALPSSGQRPLQDTAPRPGSGGSSRPWRGRHRRRDRRLGRCRRGPGDRRVRGRLVRAGGCVHGVAPLIGSRAALRLRGAGQHGGTRAPRCPGAGRWRTTVTVPPWSSPTQRAIARPRPVPPPASSPEPKRSKTRSTRSTGMPGPSSRTSSDHVAASTDAARRAPRGPAGCAARRCRRGWPPAGAGAPGPRATVSWGGSTAVRTRTVRPSTPASAATSSRSSATTTSVSSRGAAPASMRERSRRSPDEGAEPLGLAQRRPKGLVVGAHDPVDEVLQQGPLGGQRSAELCETVATSHRRCWSAEARSAAIALKATGELPDLVVRTRRRADHGHRGPWHPRRSSSRAAARSSRGRATGSRPGRRPR